VFCTVRSNAELVLDTITRGYSCTNSVAIVPPSATAVAVNAQASRRRWISTAAATAATAASTGTTPGNHPPPGASVWVQTTKPSTSAAATGATARDRAWARARTGSATFSTRKAEPCSAASTVTVTPTYRPYGVSRSTRPPVNSWLESIGTPCSRSPSATPNSSGASRLPAVSRTVQFRRHRGESRRPRYSTETPRTISAASSSSSAG
jgi:hypothetical protein